MAVDYSGVSWAEATDCVSWLNRNALLTGTVCENPVTSPGHFERVKGERIVEEEAEIVVLRRWRSKPHAIIALFPEDVDALGYVKCYEHVGQHGTAFYELVVFQTRPAKEGENDTDELLAELRRAGYNLTIRQRRPGRM